MIEDCMARRFLIGAALVLAAGTANAGDVGEDLARAYEFAYNLDYDAAALAFEAAVAAEPDNPATHRGLAAATWMRSVARPTDRSTRLFAAPRRTASLVALVTRSSSVATATGARPLSRISASSSAA